MDQYKCTLSEEALKYAVEVLHETEEGRREKIDAIQRWLKTQSHLNARTDASLIIRFLRCCSFNVEETKERLSNFYKIRAKIPEWFENRNSQLPVIQDLLNMGVYLPLRQRDSSGRLIFVIRAAKHNPSQYSINDVFKLSNMISDITMEEDEDYSVLGCVAIVDLSGVTLAHSFQMTPNFVSKAVDFWEKCTPVWIRRMDFVNAPSHVNIVLDIFRRFMTPSFRSGVYVHKNQLASLHSVYSPNILPTEYGGTDGTIQEITDLWRIKLKKYSKWLMEDEKYKANYLQKVPSRYNVLQDT